MPNKLPERTDAERSEEFWRKVIFGSAPKSVRAIQAIVLVLSVATAIGVLIYRYNLGKTVLVYNKPFAWVYILFPFAVLLAVYMLKIYLNQTVIRTCGAILIIIGVCFVIYDFFA